MEHRGFYISRTKDCDENEGGLFCQVYVGDNCLSDEIDNFCLHQEELRNYSEEYLIEKYINDRFDELFKLGNRMLCNMCEGENLAYREYKGTHIWICDNCPNIQFESIERKDINNLKELLESGDE